MSELLSAAQAAVKLAKDAGADDAWASISRDRSVSHGFRDGNLEKVEESTSRGLSVAIYAAGRYSSHATTDLREDRLASFIREAVALTRALQPDPFRKIPAPELFEGRATVDLERLDPALAGVGADDRLAWCRELDAAAHGDPRVISAECGVFSGESEGASVSSNGFSGTWEGGYLGYSATATVRDEGDRRPEGSHFVYGRFHRELPEPGVVAAEALRRALDRLGAAKGPTGKATMVVDPQAAVSLVARLMGPASAASIQQGRSFWAGKAGEQVFGAALTVVDDPLIPRGLASRHFDGEGIAAKARTIIDAGTIRGYYVDTYYGRKLGLPPTSGSPSNRLIRPGDRSLAELLRAVGSGIYVTSWLGGNSDSTTGDFSLGLRGHRIEGGEIGAPVGEMNVTGNLADLFRRLAMLGDDPYPYSSIRAPSMVFDGVNFSGA